MSAFRRTIRLFLLILQLGGAALAAVVLYLTRYLVRPPRLQLWATPRDVGLEYEQVQFPARDGVRLSGWFVGADSAESRTPAVILLHGLGWNRLGTRGTSFMDNIIGALPVDFLRLTHALHRAGYSVLTLDLRNHGMSAVAPPMTWGLQEANDVLGAVDYLMTREDVDADHIGAVGFSIGANAALFALPHADQLRALVAVQPMSPSQFTERFASDMLSIFGLPAHLLVTWLYKLIGGLSYSAVNPLTVAARVNVPVLYVQGNRDRWGSLEEVATMAHVTPGAVQPVFVDAGSRYEGHQFPILHADHLISFLQDNL